MSDKIKVVRLSKVAREFNIALDTVVDFLSDKGFNIIKNPNTKIDPQMYAILQDEFHDEKELKKAAKERNLEFLGQGHLSADSTKTKAESNKKEDADIPEELFIKNMPVGNTVEIKQPTKEEPVVEKRLEEEIVIELPISKAEVVEEVIEEIIEEPIVEEKVEEIIEEIVEEPKVETPEVKETVEEIIEVVQEVVEEVQEVVEEIVEAIQEEEVPETVETVVAVEEPTLENEEIPVEAEKEVEVETTPEVVSEETVKEDEIVTETEKDSKEIKVIGKIDLAGMNMRTRPKRKSKEEKRKEADAKRKPSTTGKKVETKAETKVEVKTEKEKTVTKKEEIVAPKVETVTTAPPAVKEEKPKEEKKHDDNFIPTKYTKLSGPKVLDKIILPTIPKKKKPVASSSDDVSGRSKRKRKRIKPTPTTTPTTGQTTTRKPVQKRGKPGGSGPIRRIVKAEPTEEDIQKKIKETLNRLAPAGKSKASKYRRQKRDQVSENTRDAQEREAEEKGILKVTEFVTANELATMMDVGVTDVIKTCMQVGLFVSINQRLDAETIALLAEEFGFQTEFISVDDQESYDIQEVEDLPEDLLSRSPIVTVMGHVDHGKTKLLDYVRKANVVAGEAGGITQHIGAYEVVTESGKSVTFLDTPGHEAFTAMRARGAKVTDIAIIVIAADDSVMPQTREAINHAQAAGVPIVFAFNKMDKPGASSDKIKDQLSQMNILVEDWGGKFQSQEISAITGSGISDLLEKVLLEAEMLDLKANPAKPGKGTVIEATLDKGRGYVTTVLVQEGTMRKGDIVIAGPVYGRVKAMFNERNKSSIIAGPSVPVVILGLNGAPQAGDIFNVMLEEKEAKNLVNKRQQLIREQSLRTQKHITLDEIGRRIAIGDFKEMNLIVKGDVDGSVEALSDELLKLSTKEVQINVIHKAVGAITESDIMLASASDAIIIGFQVRPVPQARKLAEKEQIDIRLYSIIYQATEEIKAAVEGMLSPKTEEKIVCNIEVREVFKITKVGTIAGCYVLDGKLNRKTNIRLIRDGIVVYTGQLGSLKRFKDDVKEVSAGYECGLNIERFNDIKVGDIVEGYEEVEVAR